MVSAQATHPDKHLDRFLRHWKPLGPVILNLDQHQKRPEVATVSYVEAWRGIVDISTWLKKKRSIKLPGSGYLI
ncbi:hypothetical protein RB213_013205 [Colletotrichum asianum]